MEEKLTMKDILNKVETVTALMQKDLSYIREKVDTLEKQIATNYVTQIEFKDSTKRLDRLEDTNIWVTRMIVGSVLLAVIGLVVAVR